MISLKFTEARQKERKKANYGTSPQLGFGVIEVIISLFLLALLGVLIAGGLIQSVLANSRNVLYASASQLVTQEAARIQSTVFDCSTLTALISLTTPVTTLTLADNRIISVKSEPIGWATCGSLASKIYPIKVSAVSDSVEVLTVESLVVIR